MLTYVPRVPSCPVYRTCFVPFVPSQLSYWAVRVQKTFSNQDGESAKLCALRAKNVLACQSVLRAYVLSCQRALHAYVLTCLRALRAYVLTCKSAILIDVNSFIIQICYLYLGLKRGNIGEMHVNYWNLSVCYKFLHRRVLHLGV